MSYPHILHHVFSEHTRREEKSIILVDFFLLVLKENHNHWMIVEGREVMVRLSEMSEV